MGDGRMASRTPHHMATFDQTALLILAIVISMLSLLTNLVELSVMLTIRPLVTKLVETMVSIQSVNQQMLNTIAIINDRTSRPND